jgi:hypothetical protein
MFGSDLVWVLKRRLFLVNLIKIDAVLHYLHIAAVVFFAPFLALLCVLLFAVGAVAELANVVYLAVYLYLFHHGPLLFPSATAGGLCNYTSNSRGAQYEKGVDSRVCVDFKIDGKWL